MLLSDIMAMPTPGDKYHIAVETCATGPMVRAVIHEGSGMQWVESGGTIVVLPATIVNAKQLTGQRLGRDERKTLRDSYAVANVVTKKARKVQNNERKINHERKSQCLCAWKVKK
jgi:hypothetical protein